MKTVILWSERLTILIMSQSNNDIWISIHARMSTQIKWQLCMHMALESFCLVFYTGLLDRFTKIILDWNACKVMHVPASESVAVIWCQSKMGSCSMAKILFYFCFFTLQNQFSINAQISSNSYYNTPIKDNFLFHKRLVMEHFVNFTAWY